MADEKTTVLLDVSVNSTQSVQNIKELKKAVSDLTAEQKKLEEQGQKNSTEYVANEQKIKALNKAIAQNTAAIQADIKQATSAVGSYNELSAQLTKLKQAYHAAGTDAEREAILKDLRRVSDELKALDEAQGVYVRNVGNYKSAISDLVPGFDQLNAILGKVGLDITNVSASISKGFANVGTSLSNLTKAVSSGQGIKSAFADAGKAVLSFGKTLLASPIGWIAAAIAALVAIFMKLRDAIKKNDEASTNFAKLFDSLRPIIDLVTKAFAGLAKILGKVAGVLADVVGRLSGGVADAQALTTAIDDLEETERQYTVKSAERNRDIAKLMDKSMDKEAYNAEQRKAFLEEATKLERQNLEDEKAIAAEHLRILEETAAREKDTSDETMNKIAEARAAMYKAEENYYNGIKNINKKISSLNSEIQKEEEDKAKAAAEAAKKRAEAAKKAAEERKKAAEEAYKNEVEIRKMAEDLVVSLIEDETEKSIAARKLQGDREIEDLKNRLANEKNLTDEARATLSQLIIDKQAALDAELEKMAVEAEKKKSDAAAQKAKETAAKTAQLRVEAAEDGSEEEFKEKKDLLSLQMDQELANTELTEEQKLLIKQKYQEQFAALDKAWTDSLKTNAQNAMKEATKGVSQAVEYAQKASGIVDSVFSAIAENEDANLEQYKKDSENKKEILKARLDSGVISQAEYEEQVTKINEDAAKKEKELQLKQAKRTKAMAIMNATLNAAAAIIASLAQSPVAIGIVPNPAGIASLALATATGAAQVAAAAATPLPKASRGALLRGNSHAQGGIPIEAEGGEAIINKRSTSRFLPLLSAINQAGGGVPLYGDGGTVRQMQRAANALDYAMLAEAMAAVNVSVAVTDINRGQSNYAKVESLRSY